MIDQRLPGASLDDAGVPGTPKTIILLLPAGEGQEVAVRTHSQVTLDWV